MVKKEQINICGKKEVYSDPRGNIHDSTRYIIPDSDGKRINIFVLPGKKSVLMEPGLKPLFGWCGKEDSC